jgi:predicted transcriptional regulator YdeE
MYNKEFYKKISQQSLKSAEQIMPVIFEFIQPKSVIDFGCGVGSWLCAFKKNGVEEILGLDGEWVDKSQLLIDKSEFLSCDFIKENKNQKKFDLAISTEVAEHLPKDVSEKFIENLTAAADVIMFSAAIPYQGGTKHINEQWPEYWANLFYQRGYVVADCIRPKIWNNPDVDFWLAQNLLFFVNKNVLEKHPELAESARKSDKDYLSKIHPRHYINIVDPLFKIKFLLKDKIQ